MTGIRADLRIWWNAHFSDFTRKEAWGYAVWLLFAVFVLVPELWAAFWKDSAPFPTISGTTGELEYRYPALALLVTGTIVLCVYSAFRYPPQRTGVLAPAKPGPDDAPAYQGDAALPYRTPGGGRFTRSITPVRELAAKLYFVCALVAILAGTTIAALITGGTDEYAVGRTLYGLLLLLWALVPSLLAWPKRFALDIPFPTLFSTVRSLERRLRVLALIVIAGLTILLLHLVLYPWPSIIPDLSRTHTYNKCHPLKPRSTPLSAAEQQECQRLDDAAVRPSPKAT
ncbi:MAG: hypothetical protein QOE29_892 [Gaiellaceae bacterium]|nr:hypothetical protein [Gaiellaceae bacterium]